MLAELSQGSWHWCQPGGPADWIWDDMGLACLVGQLVVAGPGVSLGSLGLMAPEAPC